MWVRASATEEDDWGADRETLSDEAELRETPEEEAWWGLWQPESF